MRELRTEIGRKARDETQNVTVALAAKLAVWPQCRYALRAVRYGCRVSQLSQMCRVSKRHEPGQAAGAAGSPLVAKRYRALESAPERASEILDQ